MIEIIGHPDNPNCSLTAVLYTSSVNRIIDGRSIFAVCLIQAKIVAVPVGRLIFPVVDLLHLAEARGVVCYGPSHGTEPTFVRADVWIHKWQGVPQEEAEELLLRIYLRTYGPSTATDFALWSGITLTDAREI